MDREISNDREIKKETEAKEAKPTSFEALLEPEYKNALEAGVRAFQKVHAASPEALAKFREALALELACYQDRGIKVSVKRTQEIEQPSSEYLNMQVKRPPLNRSR